MALNACTHVNIPDSEWCGDMGADGATCFHTSTTAQRDVPKPQWDTERFGMVCTVSSNFAAWKDAIEQLCHKTKLCTQQEQAQVSALFQRFEAIRQKQLLAKRH